MAAAQFPRKEVRITSVVRFAHVSREYESSATIRDLTFEIKPGELVALIGPGDAGKTNVLRLLLGLSHPDEGEIEVFGHEAGSVDALQQMGAVLDSSDFPAPLKVREVIDLVRAHYADPAPVADLAEQCGLQDQLGERIGDLSPAETRWVAILLAFAGNPSGVFMDMPTLGMDVGWRRQFWNLLREYTDGGGLALVTSMVLHEVEVFATRTIIMHQGAIVADGPVDQIIAEHGRRRMSMRSESLPDLDGIAEVEWRDAGPIIHSSDSDAVVRELAKQNVSFKDLEVRRPSLEEVLLSLIEEGNL